MNATSERSTRQHGGGASRTAPRTAPPKDGGDSLARVKPAAVPSSITAPAGAAATSAPPAPRRLLCHNPDAVLADAAAGAELLTFNRATGLKFLQVHGRRPHVAVLHRAANPSNLFPLESAVVNGVRVTTALAITRWILAQSRQSAKAEVPKPQNELRRRERTESKLDALGIK